MQRGGRNAAVVVAGKKARRVEDRVDRHIGGHLRHRQADRRLNTGAGSVAGHAELKASTHGQRVEPGKLTVAGGGTRHQLAVKDRLAAEHAQRACGLAFDIPGLEPATGAGLPLHDRPPAVVEPRGRVADAGVVQAHWRRVQGVALAVFGEQRGRCHDGIGEPHGATGHVDHRAGVGAHDAGAFEQHRTARGEPLRHRLLDALLVARRVPQYRHRRAQVEADAAAVERPALLHRGVFQVARTEQLGGHEIAAGRDFGLGGARHIEHDAAAHDQSCTRVEEPVGAAGVGRVKGEQAARWWLVVGPALGAHTQRSAGRGHACAGLELDRAAGHLDARRGERRLLGRGCELALGIAGGVWRNLDDAAGTQREHSPLGGALGDLRSLLQSAGVATREQQHRAVLADAGGGTDAARLVHRHAHQRGVAACRDDLAGVRDRAVASAHFNQQPPHRRHLRVDLGGVDALGGRRLQVDLGARAEHGLTARCFDATGVQHVFGEQEHTSATGAANLCTRRHFDEATTHRRRAKHRRVELQARPHTVDRIGQAAEKVGVVDVECGSDQRAHVDARAGAEQNAVAVEQVDLPVGAQGPEDRTRLQAVQDPVERAAAGIGHAEVDTAGGADVEAGPVVHRAVAGLVDALVNAAFCIRRVDRRGRTGAVDAPARRRHRHRTRHRHHRPRRALAQRLQRPDRH